MVKVRTTQAYMKDLLIQVRSKEQGIIVYKNQLLTVK